MIIREVMTSEVKNEIFKKNEKIWKNKENWNFDFLKYVI